MAILATAFAHLLAHAGEAGESHGFTFHMPPLHPILVNFTAALIPASIISDALGRLRNNDGFHKAGWWTLLYAAVITPLTAVAGWWWLRQMGGMNDWRMPIHMWLGFSMAAVAIALAAWRWRFHRAGRVPTWSYLAVAGLAMGALVVQGELGGQMSFGSMETAVESQHGSNKTSGDPMLPGSMRTGSMPHDSMPHRSTPSTPASQPATKPDGAEHQHGHPTGSLEWHDVIELKG